MMLKMALELYRFAAHFTDWILGLLASPSLMLLGGEAGADVEWWREGCRGVIILLCTPYIN